MFSSDDLKDKLRSLIGGGVIDARQTLWVAYSGGMDSSVLLHAMSGIRDEIAHDVRAIHVNHHLSPNSDQWQQHCIDTCHNLAIPLNICEIILSPDTEKSPEELARQARYQAIYERLDDGDVLLTAHHKDDQAETLLLQLLRGGGPRGAAAMPQYMRLPCGHLFRPLLCYDRQQLESYARSHHLQWVDDQSNQDTGLERNYLRHEIIPRLRSHWPSVTHVLARDAGLFAEASGLLDELAELDFDQVQGTAPHTLSVSGLCTLSGARQRNVLRYWMRGLHLPTANAVHLRHIMTDVIHAAPDREPCVSWSGAEVRRYRDDLYALTPLTRHDSRTRLAWDATAPLALPDGGCLVPARRRGAGLRASECGQDLQVGFRLGGESCRPAGQAHHRPLKKLLQESNIPPWERDRIPLIYIDGRLAEVVGHFVCEPFLARSDEDAIAVTRVRSPA
jgi:tRNA(Ile)-lysidine synthase